MSHPGNPNITERSSASEANSTVPCSNSAEPSSANTPFNRPTTTLNTPRNRFREIRQGCGGTFTFHPITPTDLGNPRVQRDKDRSHINPCFPYPPSLTSSWTVPALGACYAVYCVLVYFEVDDSRAFVAHIESFSHMDCASDLITWMHAQRAADGLCEMLVEEAEREGWPDWPNERMKRTLRMVCPSPNISSNRIMELVEKFCEVEAGGERMVRVEGAAHGFVVRDIGDEVMKLVGNRGQGGAFDERDEPWANMSVVLTKAGSQEGEVVHDYKWRARAVVPDIEGLMRRGAS